MRARDVLSGRKIDLERGCIIKAEMAKKNLHTKRGLTSGYEGFKQYGTNIPTYRRRSNFDSFSGDSGYSKMGDFSNYLHPIYQSSGSQYSDGGQIHSDEFDPFAPTNPAMDSDILGAERFFSSDNYGDEFENRIPQLFGTSQPSRGFSSVLYNSDALLSKSLGSMNISDYPGMDAYDSRRNSFSYSNSVPPGADQNPPCNTLYVGNLPNENCEDELRRLFQSCPGYKRLSYKTRPNGPMCFVEVLF